MVRLSNNPAEIRAKQKIRDGVVARINACGALLVAVQTQVELGALGMEELSALISIGEQVAAMQQMTMVHVQAQEVQVVSVDESRFITG
jgi:hypothetical protein